MQIDLFLLSDHADRRDRRGRMSMGATRGADFLRSKKYGRLPIYIRHGITLPLVGRQ